MTLQIDRPASLADPIPDVLPAYFLEQVPSPADDLPHAEPPVPGKPFQTIAAIAALMIGLISISLSALLVRYGEQELSPYAIAFNRYWITAVVLGGWFGLKALGQRWMSRQPQDPASEADALMGENLDTVPNTKATESAAQGWIGWSLLALGAFLAADLVLWAWSLTQTTVANATLLANLTPVYTCLMGWLFWGKRFDRRLLIGMAIALVGTLAIGLGDLQLGTAKLLGDGVALLGGFAFALYLLMVEQLQTRLSTTAIIFWSSAIAAGLTFPIVLLTGNILLPISWQGWVTVVSLALICQVLGQGLLAHSLNSLSCEFVAIFLLLDPVLAALGGWVFFSEALGLATWLAFAVVLLGIYLASSSQSTVKETTLNA